MRPVSDSIGHIDQPSFLMAIANIPTILLVEDELIIRMGIAGHIHGQGYAVIEAGSGDRAMNIIESGKPIDVIITDVQMPGRHDGIALALWARRNFPQIKIIIVSGATSGVVEHLGEEGKIMPKPYDHEEIVARIETLVGRPASPSASQRDDVAIDAPRP
jgi:DNA-binding response OmpR family regulator